MRPRFFSLLLLVATVHPSWGVERRHILHVMGPKGLGNTQFHQTSYCHPATAARESARVQPRSDAFTQPTQLLAMNPLNNNFQTAQAPGPPPFSVAFVPYSLVPDIPKSGGGGATSLTFENHLKISVKLWWVDGGGGHKPYGELAAGATKKQGSYAQHVWLITNQADKPLGYFVASSAPALAKIIND